MRPWQCNANEAAFTPRTAAELYKRVLVTVKSLFCVHCIDEYAKRRLVITTFGRPRRKTQPQAAIANKGERPLGGPDASRNRNPQPQTKPKALWAAQTQAATAIRNRKRSTALHCIAAGLRCIAATLHCIATALHCIATALHCIAAALHCGCFALRCIAALSARVAVCDLGNRYWAELIELFFA